MKLATTYLGLKLRTPLVPSASPLSEKLDNIKRMEDAGAAAVVFHSLSQFNRVFRKFSGKSPTQYPAAAVYVDRIGENSNRRVTNAQKNA